MRRTVYEPEHEQFREVVREFLAREVAPHAGAWEKAGIVDREVYRAAGKHGVIGFNVPEEFGGAGVDDFRFNAVVTEELARADTAELFFDQVPVPAASVLGQAGQGFYHLMHNLPAERMSIAVSAVAGARAIFAETLEYAKNRQAFGRPIGSFQHNRFVLAELDTELDLAQVFVDRCLEAMVAGELTAVEAAKAKWWTTELQKRVIDACLQMHGGYGYMMEFPVARAYLDTRVQTIYGGSTEIMKEIVGRNLGV